MSERRDRRRLFLTSAAEAAGALARLLGCEEPKEPLYCEPLTLGELRARLFPRGGRPVAIFADLNGGVMGHSGVAFSPAAAEGVVERLLGEAPKDGLPDCAELDAQTASTLREVGNIAISALAGVLGQWDGDTVVPSVPRLGSDLGTALALETATIPPELERMPAYLVETELPDPGSPVPAAIIWIPGE